MNPPGGKVYTVSELNHAVKALLEEGFASIWVSGEVSNLSRPSSGHVYFTLKDRETQIRAVMWRGVSLRTRFELKDGLEVLIRGRLSVYTVRGEYQVQIDEIQPKGLGAMELALRQLKERLARLGYFALERKKPLPRYPKRVALVTSPTGAAIRDILEILGRRWPAALVLVCPVRVQGDGASEEIAAAINLVNSLKCADVLICGRGGGSVEDLWAFNDERIAQAIFQSRIPVISAVGHEIDLTIADLVADCRALTPSEAAERAVPDREELLSRIKEVEGQLGLRLTQRIGEARDRLREISQRRCFRLPLEAIRDREQKLDDLSQRLPRALDHLLSRFRERMQGLAGRLGSLSPLNVLSRGYTLTRREADRMVVRLCDQVAPGDRIITHLQRGAIVSRVEQVVDKPTQTIPWLETPADLARDDTHEPI